MDITLYNTLTKKREVFKPMVEGKVSLYACGVTVYDVCHIGHGMQAIIYDVIRNFFQHMGYEVKYVRNYTDVDDKIIERAASLGVSALEHSKRMIRVCEEDMARLGVLSADVEPKVSEHIPEIVAVIERIIENGVAYASEGDVYYSVSSKSDYGKLSNRNVDEMQAGSRVDINTKKRDPMDFALWKAAKEGEVAWPSPWGNGRPGWHIECSAMALKHLGECFDIHGGGTDLIFPHHENEVAQSESATGKPFCNYWVHNGLVTVEGRKMSKSLNNFMSIEDATSRNHHETIRYAILTHHYSSNIDFNEQAFYNAYSRLQYFYTTLKRVDDLLAGASDYPETVPDGVEVPDLDTAFRKAMCDDFNTTVAISELGSAFKFLNDFMAAKSPKKMKAKLHTLKLVRDPLVAALKVLGFLLKDPVTTLAEISNYLIKTKGIDTAQVEELVAARQQVRIDKDWAQADVIREQLTQLGVSIMDTATGTEWQVQP